MMGQLSDEFLLIVLKLALGFLNQFLVEPSNKRRSSINKNNNSSSSGSGSGSRNKRTSGESYKGHDPNCDETNSVTSKLQLAYACFETTETTITRDTVRKMFKRLSLIHHPDRNSNSAESIAEMQTINQYYDLLQDDLDRRNAQGDEGSPSATGPHSPTSSSHPQEMHDSRGHHQEQPTREQSTNRQELWQHKKQERQRKTIEREMKREWEESQHDLRDFQAQRDKWRRNNLRFSMHEDLDTAWGRDKAHQLYMMAIQRYQEYLRQPNPRQKDQHRNPELKRPKHCLTRSERLRDVNDDDDGRHCLTSPSISINDSGHIDRPVQGISAGKPGERPPTKPKNLLMEYCNEDAVVAIRLGRTDIAVEILRREMQTATERWLSFRLREAHAKFPPRNNGLSVSLDDRCCRHIFRSLMRPLDEERNTIWHYAVYLEDEKMISYLVHVARRYQLFPELIMYKNIHHLTASAYAGSCSPDSVLPGILASLMHEARGTLEEKRFGATSRRMIQESFQPHPSFYPLLRTMICLAVGRIVFRCSWAVSLVLTIVVTLHNKKGEGPLKERKVLSLASYFVAIHIWWFLARMVFMHGRTAMASITFNTLPCPWEFQIFGFIVLAFTLKMQHVTNILNVLADAVAFTQSVLTCRCEEFLYFSHPEGRRDGARK
jgi:curved DNA-binding protein CbpA